MGLLDKFFGFGKNEPESDYTPLASAIKFGRYSDNNKTLAKTNKWYEAEDLFKDKKINEGIEAFFDYLRDDKEDNVRLVREPNGYSFDIYQGTKIVHGSIDDTEITAYVSLAKMEEASVPVMRRLLQFNFSLFYSRYALKDDVLCMLFDTNKHNATPNKLYYGLKELATKADKQDDLLVTDFTSLKLVDDSHVEKFSEAEANVKYDYFKSWIEGTLQRIEELNQDNFSGGIAYMLLNLIYRIDFLIAPEGKLLNELERINNIYWSNKEEKNAVERNQLLKDAFKKLVAWDKAEVMSYFYRAKATYAITPPKAHTAIADSIKGATDNTTWYIENKYNDIAAHIMEYGIAYCQFSYSLPKPMTELILMYMHINHNDYFEALGFSNSLFKNQEFRKATIESRILYIINEFKDKYALLKLDVSKLKYDSLQSFNLSFLKELEFLNFESKS